MMTACVSSIPAQQPKRQVPENLLAECQDQAVAPDGKLSTLLRISVERSEQYAECKARHKSLSEFVRNINRSKDK